MNSIENVKKQIKLIVPKDWSSDEKGKFLEGLVADLLRRQRFSVEERVSFTGMEIDVLGQHLDTEEKVFVECKFIKDTFEAGVITNLLGKAVIQGINRAYLFSTAHPSKGAKGRLEEMKKSPPIPHIPDFIFVFIGPEKLFEWFVDVKGLKLPDFGRHNIEIERVGKLHLLITPYNILWVVEEVQQGLPSRAIIFPTSNNCRIDIEEIRNLFLENDFCSGLVDDIVDGTKINAQSHIIDLSSSIDAETVTSVGMADSFDDYRPCRPQDFVGRSELQQDVLDFLEKVRQEETSTRIFCFSGSSGFGKSSLILKLEDKFQKTPKLKQKFHLFPIDVRAAQRPLFVAKAIKTAIEQAIEKKFIELPNQTISIESTEQLFASASIQLVLEQLKSTNRVLVIFFDQFEELYTKESLFHTFEMFEKIAFEVDSLQSNIVLGFCWRTGVSFTGEHPAYMLWHKLEDKRREFKVDHFSSKESLLLLTQLSKHLNQQLNPKLRRRLSEECQGLPWLLKKLCIHIYHQIRNGTTQGQLVDRLFNVKYLFDQDLEQLSEREKDCLKYIAENSPCEDATVKFGASLVECLCSNRRLVIRVGQKYTIYWDTFRDYILGKPIPGDDLKYIPRMQLPTALKALLLLQEDGSINSTTLRNQLGYCQNTTKNVSLDLQYLRFAVYQNNLIKIREDVKDLSQNKVADHIAKQLKDHLIIKEAYNQLVPGSKMTFKEFKELFSKAYPATNTRTVETYVSRLIPWLCFAGLLEHETEPQEMIVRPIDSGKQKGKFTNRLKISIFMCESHPQQVIDTVMQLIREGRFVLSSPQLDKVASDLTRLGLAKRANKCLSPAPELSRFAISNNLEDEVHRHIKSLALSSPFLSSLSQINKNNPRGSLEEWSSEISKSCSIPKSWTTRLVKRSISSGRIWLSFFGEDIKQSLPLFPNMSF
jgi:hypothetical protein